MYFIPTLFIRETFHSMKRSRISMGSKEEKKTMRVTLVNSIASNRMIYYILFYQRLSVSNQAF